MSMSNYENNGKLISREVLVNFVAQYAFAYIGHDGEKQTTLSDEMAAIAKMVSRADVCRIAVDPYRPRLAFAMAELTEAEKLSQVRNNYRRAGKKIFWLNSICKVLTGETFITRHLDTSDLDDVEELVDDFEAIIRFAASC